jgi:hypothetical protein
MSASLFAEHRTPMTPQPTPVDNADGASEKEH